jgi:hypothetical protein
VQSKALLHGNDAIKGIITIQSVFQSSFSLRATLSEAKELVTF